MEQRLNLDLPSRGRLTTEKRSTQKSPPLLLKQPVEDDEIDLGQLVRTVWRGKWQIALSTLIALLIGGVYVFGLAVPVYTAKSLVALEPQQSQVLDLQSVVSGLSGDQASINTELEVLKSRGLSRKLVNALDLTADPEFNESLREEPGFSIAKVKSMLLDLVGASQPPQPAPSEMEILEKVVSATLEKIEVSNIRNSYVFEIRVTTEAPDKSAKIANSLADIYILNQLDVKFDATQKATDWLTQRVSVLEQELAAAETAVKEFNAGTDLVSPETLEALNRQAKDSRDRIASISATLTSQERDLARLEEAWETQDRDAMAEAAKAVDPDRAPTLAMSEQAFQSRFMQLLNSARASVARSRSQVENLGGAVEEIEARVKSQSQDLLQLEQLSRQADALRSVYEYFLGRMQETSAQQGIQEADSRILSEAVIPIDPSAPRKARILALFGILGLMLGAGLVLLREMTNRTVRTAEELETLTGLSVLGQVPLVPGGKRHGQIEYLARKQSSAGAEAIRNLRTSILFSDVDSPPQVIMLTSSIPGEGKTTLSLALAQSFSGLNKRVLLVEGDLRRQVFSQYFPDLPVSGSLLTVLSGQQALSEAVQRSELIGADLLRADKTTVNAADVFSSERFASLMREARASYDVIIIDTPPVLVVPDARSIAQVADALVFSVKWDSTETGQIVDAIRMFESVNISLTGLVLNQINRKGMKKYGYGGKYGAYAGYGHKYYNN